MLKTAVDRFGRSVTGAGPVEVGQDVGGPFLQCPSEGDQFLQRLGNVGAQRGDQRCHECAAFLAVGVAIGGHGALIHRPGGLDLGMGVNGEQGL